MKNKFMAHPIMSSFASVVLTFTVYLLLRTIIFVFFGGLYTIYLDGIIRGVVSIPAIKLLGTIVQKDGFKHVFSFKGAKDAVIASAAFLLCFLIPIIKLLNMSKVNEDSGILITSIVFYDSLSAVFEEVLNRGLLMTPILIKYGDTTRRRLAIMIISGAFFGLGHIFNGIGLLGVLLISIMGISFSSIYLYSGNLIIPIIVHALWNHLYKLSNRLIAEVYHAMLPTVLDNALIIIILTVMPIYAIFICIKSKQLF